MAALGTAARLATVYLFGILMWRPTLASRYSDSTSAQVAIPPSKQDALPDATCTARQEAAV